MRNEVINWIAERRTTIILATVFLLILVALFYELLDERLGNTPVLMSGRENI